MQWHENVKMEAMDSSRLIMGKQIWGDGDWGVPDIPDLHR